MKNQIITILSIIACTPALTQNLTLEKAIKLGLERKHFQASLRSEEDLAKVQTIRAKTWGNPDLYVTHESIEISGLETDDTYYLLSQNIPINGVKKLQTKAAQHGETIARLQNDSRTLQLKTQITQQFFKTLYLQERLDALITWRTETAQITRIMTERERAGEASGYDRRRLQRELAEVKAITAKDRAALAHQNEILRSLIGLDKLPKLSGNLLPAEPQSQDIPINPTLLVFDEEVKAASIREKAARKAFSNLTLEAGMRHTTAPSESDRGVFVGVRLPLPLIHRNPAKAAESRALSLKANSEKALAQERLQGKSQALTAQIQQMKGALADYQKEGLNSSQELALIARLAFVEGEMELFLLLDAYRSLRDARLETLSMQHHIRQLDTLLKGLGGVQ